MMQKQTSIPHAVQVSHGSDDIVQLFTHDGYVYFGCAL